MKHTEKDPKENIPLHPKHPFIFFTGKRKLDVGKGKDTKPTAVSFPLDFERI